MLAKRGGHQGLGLSEKPGTQHINLHHNPCIKTSWRPLVCFFLRQGSKRYVILCAQHLMCGKRLMQTAAFFSRTQTPKDDFPHFGAWVSQDDRMMTTLVQMKLHLSFKQKQAKESFPAIVIHLSLLSQLGKEGFPTKRSRTLRKPAQFGDN